MANLNLPNVDFPNGLFIGTDRLSVCELDANTLQVTATDQVTVKNWRTNTVALGGGSITAIGLLDFDPADDPGYQNGRLSFQAAADKLRVGGAAGIETVSSA